MGLKIRRSGGREENEMRNGYVLKERLYKTADGEVVREGHQDAATVYRGIGQQISLAEAAELGLVDGEVVEQAAVSGDFDLDKVTDDGLVELFVDSLLEIKARDVDLADEAAWPERLGEDRMESLSRLFSEEGGDDGGTETPISESSDDQLLARYAEIMQELEARDKAPTIEVTVAEPFEGYGEANSDDVIAKVAELSLADLVALREAEEGGKARKGVLAAINDRLEPAEKALAEAGAA